MDYCAGIDVSLELSNVCVVDSSDKIVRETKVTSKPKALLQHFADLGLSVIRVGLDRASDGADEQVHARRRTQAPFSAQRSGAN